MFSYVLPKSFFRTLSRKTMWASIKKRFLFNTMPPNAVSLLLTLHFLMQFRCCGVTNHTDWFEVYNATRVPDSCCLEYSDNCGLDNPGTWWTAVSFGRKNLPSQSSKSAANFSLSCVFFFCSFILVCLPCLPFLRNSYHTAPNPVRDWHCRPVYCIQFATV